MRLAGCVHANRGCSAQRAGAIGALLAATASLAAMPTPAVATFCTMSNHGPCTPLSHDPLLMVQAQPDTWRPPRSGETLDTLQQLFARMEACWEPPPLDQARPGTEITIRFSLNRSGDIIGEPRFTYSTPSLPSEIKAAYQRALAAMLKRCTPFALSPGLGGAIAGRPISTRFIDDRGQRRTEIRHE